MQPLQSILPGVLHRRGLHAQAQASQVTHVAERWIRTALPHLAEFISVETLTHATLTVACSHGIAAQECVPLLPALREFLARECKGATVRDIRMVRSRS